MPPTSVAAIAKASFSHCRRSCYGPVCNPVWRAFSRNGALIMGQPASWQGRSWLGAQLRQAPRAARRYAALGLDRLLQPSKLADYASDAPISIDTPKLNPPAQKSRTQNFSQSPQAGCFRRHVADAPGSRRHGSRPRRATGFLNASGTRWQRGRTSDQLMVRPT